MFHKEWSHKVNMEWALSRAVQELRTHIAPITPTAWLCLGQFGGALRTARECQWGGQGSLPGVSTGGTCQDNSLQCENKVLYQHLPEQNQQNEGKWEEREISLHSGLQ